MKLAAAFLLFSFSGVGAFFWFRGDAGKTGADLTSKTLVKDVVPFGVNLGVWTTWGADQLSSNIVKNPGFEGMVDRAIVIPVHVAADSFDDSPVWMARAESFWDGGRYDIRSGPSAGSSGVISHSIKQNLFGLPSFVVSGDTARPYPGDAVAVTRESNTDLPAQWWFEGAANSFAPEPAQVRPGSPGARSLRITGQAGQKAELISYFDTITTRAGKLLPLNERWELSFWTRLNSGSASLHAKFGRDGSPSLLSRDIPLSSAWTNQKISFEGSDAGPAGTVSLRFQVASGSQGQVLLDDVELRRVSDSGSAFRHEVVSVLQDLHPRYLRDWEGQLGDTLANRTAPAFARKSYRYRTGDANQSDFGYGLGDFLELCLKIHSNPWIVVPTTFSDSECAGLGTYLDKHPGRAQFTEVITEFGNENWNELFRPAGIPDPRVHGEAADRCFAAIREHAPGVPLKTVVNAQHVFVSKAIEFARQSGTSDMEAVAPYFLYGMADGAASNDSLKSLFAGDGGALKKIAAAMPALKKDLAVYEVNLTTTEGTALGSQRNPIVAGQATAAALAKTMLDALTDGARRQCVYSLSGFDSKLPGEQGYVRLWGITRDLGPTSRLRPTGLALKLLNRLLDHAVSGQMVRVDMHGVPGVSVYGFHSQRGWGAAVVSSSASAQRFDLRFDDNLAGPLPAQAFTVSSKAPGASSTAWAATNEDDEQVAITGSPVSAAGQTISYEIQPWSLAVLLPAEAKP